MIKQLIVKGRTSKQDLSQIARQCNLSVTKGKTGYELNPIEGETPNWERFKELRQHINGTVFEVLGLSSPINDYLNSIIE
jgi:hypothetical protein